MNTNKTEIAYLAGGCFWCLEAAYSRIRGVESVVSGYAGGSIENPTYEEVSSGRTGHAETVEISFDAAIITLQEILEIFFSIHNPTTPNRQGHDIGSQYRSMIFYTGETQEETAKKIVQELAGQNIFTAPIVTELKPLEKFWPAEEYHQQYFAKNPAAAYCQIVINPKLDRLKKKFGKYYRD
ncbi:MAG: peptide-methionine (S)-S-oxide reductase MsrA [Candidatus Pacebacteria bacterium]|nr:peptide-methionine (S)-S-oxide reductase MsrA [Candidatus Paceibacterota bacterium]MDR3583193.1 peptide-methionine (S)-S-oxide reductase MsrA [Candidatus Paceibacterota bacterium]